MKVRLMIKTIVFISSFILLFISCDEKQKQDAAEIIEKNTSISELSIYNLPSTWTTQNNKSIELKELQGDVLVMVMIYTSCKAACPRLVADMRAIEASVPEDKKNQCKFCFDKH